MTASYRLLHVVLGLFIGINLCGLIIILREEGWF
jgi:hypothetical protein